MEGQHGGGSENFKARFYVPGSVPARGIPNEAITSREAGNAFRGGKYLRAKFHKLNLSLYSLRDFEISLFLFKIASHVIHVCVADWSVYKRWRSSYFDNFNFTSLRPSNVADLDSNPGPTIQ